jgi:transcriptional regulator with XRE-family HTH domain
MIEQNIFWALNIKYLRKRKNMSQQQLAREIGIPRSRLNTHERGQIINPTLNDLLDFSQYFGIRVDTLLQTDLATLGESGMKQLELDNEVYLNGSMIKNLAGAVFGEKMRRQALKHMQCAEAGNKALMT